MFILSMLSQNTAQHRILWDIDAKITKIIYLHNFVLIFSKLGLIYYNISLFERREIDIRCLCHIACTLEPGT